MHNTQNAAATIKEYQRVLANVRGELERARESRQRLVKRVRMSRRNRSQYWQKVNPMNLDGHTLKVAHEYLAIVARIEREGADLDAERQDKHDELIDLLLRQNVTGISFDFDGRANAAELARKIDSWLRDL